MFKFFFCAFLFSTLFIQPSSLEEYNLDNKALFRSQPGSPISGISTQPLSPNDPTSLQSGLEDRVTQRLMQQPIGVAINIPGGMSQCDTCPCVVNTDNMYCKAMLGFCAYLTVVGCVGGIATFISHAA